MTRQVILKKVERSPDAKKSEVYGSHILHTPDEAWESPVII
ncbi:hypothetical protein [Fortiea contorta]|nr:hypothetical protein [Fortiea contorta]